MRIVLALRRCGVCCGAARRPRGPRSRPPPAPQHTPQRAPEKRPPAVVSLAFAGAVFLPLAALFLWLAATGALAFPNFPSGAASLYALVFHGAIAALLVLYWLFWTTLNLATTLPLALGLGVVIAGSGYLALSALSDARLAGERAGASAAKKTQ